MNDMGTRADFYIADASGLDWLGSIAWDGYPEGISDEVLRATEAAAFREALNQFFSDRDDVTLPERGWPWPWDDSNTTDYGYVLIEGRGVFFRGFGGATYSAAADVDRDGERVPVADVDFTYPNMKHRKNVRFDGGSGTIFVSA